MITQELSKWGTQTLPLGKGVRALLSKAYNIVDTKAHFVSVWKTILLERNVSIFLLMEGRPWESPPPSRKLGFEGVQEPARGWGSLDGSMETGDAGGLAPGAPAAGSGLSALRRSPGTCLLDPAEQADVGGPSHRRGRWPWVLHEGTAAVGSASASAAQPGAPGCQRRGLRTR